ncbi:MAG: DUF4398 domain-containing protein [Nitrospirae bacterium]|jgi:hypothetical protein|nr:DUF4398 domain-containing protein [Nitrospirota bacterium]
MKASMSGLVLIFVLILAASGCASRGTAHIESIASAELGIKIAKDSNATINAPLELKFAEDKLSAARAAATREDFVTAKRLADEALVDAKLAESKSITIKAKKQAQEMRDAIDTLRKEIDRTQMQK